MARERSVPDDKRQPTETGDHRDIGGNSVLLGRRRYLQLAGVTAAGVGSAIGVGAASGGDVDVIQLDPGERRVIRLGDGETLENVIFDQRANGSSVTVAAYGTNWRIENVAWRGPFGHNSRIIGCADTGGGTSTIRNVYAGDGVQQDMATTNGFDPSFGLWVSPEHSGTLDIERMYVEGAMDNGFYASAPGTTGAGGTVNFKDCYGKDNMISTFRTAGGRVENCVAVATFATGNPRPLWVWGTERGVPVELVDCDFIAGNFDWAMGIGRAGKTTQISAENVRQNGGVREHPRGTVNWSRRDISSGTAEDRVPRGCPTSVTEVFENASGPGGVSNENEYRTLEIAGRCSYRFEVDGRVEPAEPHDQWLEAGDAYGDDWAEWWLSGGENAHTRWHFTGELTTFSIEEHDGEIDVTTLRIDGETADPTEYVEPEETLLLIEGADEGVSRYEFAVDGDVRPTTDEGATIDEALSIGDDVVTGTVANWRDAFRLDGTLTDLTIDGPATASLDGEVVDPDDIGAALPHELVVTAEESPASYEITVDGTLMAEDEPDEETSAVVSRTTVQRSIVDGSHGYRYSGAITDVTVTDGDATVKIDGEMIDPADYVDDELAQHAIVIDGGASDEPGSYTFTIDGNVTPSTVAGAVLSDATIDDGRVDGSVNGGLHAYWFAGEIRSLELDGDAVVDVRFNAREW